MLKIKDLRVSVEDREILRGFDLEVAAGEVHAIMGPNGSGKSTLAYVLAGREGYEVTGGEIVYDGEDLLAMEPEERAAAGVFLAFQYPVEIPGVANMYFLRTALNALRRARGQDEIDAASFLKLVRERAKLVGVKQELLKRSVNYGFSGGEKKRNEILQMAVLEPRLAILDETNSGLDIDALAHRRRRRQQPASPGAGDRGDHPLSAAAQLHRARQGARPPGWPHRPFRRARARSRARRVRIRRVRARSCAGGGLRRCGQRQTARSLPARPIGPCSGPRCRSCPAPSTPASDGCARQASSVS